MNATSHPTLREWDLELSLQSEEKDLLYLTCRGAISLPDFQPEKDPLLKLLGPTVYSRKLLLNLEHASLLDTSGISWLIHGHKPMLISEARQKTLEITTNQRLALSFLCAMIQCFSKENFKEFGQALFGAKLCHPAAFPS